MRFDTSFIEANIGNPIIRPLRWWGGDHPRFTAFSNSLCDSFGRISYRFFFMNLCVVSRMEREYRDVLLLEKSLVSAAYGVNRIFFSSGVNKWLTHHMCTRSQRSLWKIRLLIRVHTPSSVVSPFWWRRGLRRMCSRTECATFGRRTQRERPLACLPLQRFLCTSSAFGQRSFIKQLIDFFRAWTTCMHCNNRSSFLSISEFDRGGSNQLLPRGTWRLAGSGIGRYPCFAVLPLCAAYNFFLRQRQFRTEPTGKPLPSYLRGNHLGPTVCTKASGRKMGVEYRVNAFWTILNYIPGSSMYLSSDNPHRHLRICKLTALQPNGGNAP